MQKLPVTEQVRTTGNLVVRTAVHPDIWILYHGSTRAGMLDAMNRFPGFFGSDENAHRVSFIVHAAALFEMKVSIILGCSAR